jgi:hypothetical protein
MVAKIKRIIKAAVKDLKRLKKFHRIPIPIKSGNYRIGAPAEV